MPLLIFAAALLIANQLVPRTVAMVALLAIDLLFLAACFMLASSLRASAPHPEYQEQRLQHGFERFFPSAMARVFSVELTVYAHIAAGLKGFINRPRPSHASYVNGSKHNGILKRVQVDRDDVASARALGGVKRRALPRTRGDGSTVLARGGVPVVEVQLHSGKKLFVASDAPGTVRHVPDIRLEKHRQMLDFERFYGCFDPQEPEGR